MLVKKAYALQEVILYLEALEQLDMVYTVQKRPEQDVNGDILPAVWIIEYKPNPYAKEEQPIQYED